MLGNTWALISWKLHSLFQQTQKSNKNSIDKFIGEEDLP